MLRIWGRFLQSGSNFLKLTWACKLILIYKSRFSFAKCFLESLNIGFKSVEVDLDQLFQKSPYAKVALGLILMPVKCYRLTIKKEKWQRYMDWINGLSVNFAANLFRICIPIWFDRPDYHECHPRFSQITPKSNKIKHISRFLLIWKDMSLWTHCFSRSVLFFLWWLIDFFLLFPEMTKQIFVPFS